MEIDEATRLLLQLVRVLDGHRRVEKKTKLREGKESGIQGRLSTTAAVETLFADFFFP